MIVVQINFRKKRLVKIIFYIPCNYTMNLSQNFVVSESISLEINYSNLSIKLAKKMINKGALDLLSNISIEKNRNINRL